MTNSHTTPLVPGSAHAGPMCPLRAVAGEATRDTGDIQGCDHKQSLVHTPPVRPFLLLTISKNHYAKPAVGRLSLQADKQAGRECNAMRCNVV